MTTKETHLFRTLAATDEGLTQSLARLERIRRIAISTNDRVLVASLDSLSDLVMELRTSQRQQVAMLRTGAEGKPLLRRLCDAEVQATAEGLWPGLSVTTTRDPFYVEDIKHDAQAVRVTIPSRWPNAAPVTIGRGQTEIEALQIAIAYADTEQGRKICRGRVALAIVEDEVSKHGRVTSRAVQALVDGGVGLEAAVATAARALEAHHRKAVAS